MERRTKDLVRHPRRCFKASLCRNSRTSTCSNRIRLHRRRPINILGSRKSSACISSRTNTCPHNLVPTCRIANLWPSSLANRSLCHTCKCITILLSTPLGPSLISRIFNHRCNNRCSTRCHPSPLFTGCQDNNADLRFRNGARPLPHPHHSMNISIPSRSRCSRSQPSAEYASEYGFHSINATFIDRSFPSDQYILNFILKNGVNIIPRLCHVCFIDRFTSMKSRIKYFRGPIMALRAFV